MKIILKRDWDVPFYPPVCESSDQGNFVGRDKELLPLINDILRKKSGSILVSGYRGVGKTSLVYKALSEVKKIQKNTIFVFLNGPQLIDDYEADSKNSNNDERIYKRKILENLIRRLYSTTIEETKSEQKRLETDTNGKINKLYRKTMAKEFRILETNIKNRELSHKIEETQTSILSFNEKDFKQLMIIFWSLFFAVIIQFTDIFPIQFLNNIAPLILIFQVPFSLKYVSEQEEKSKKEDTEQVQEEEIYQFDNNVGSLEFDLERIHQDLSLNNKKLIYIIDELDKVPTENVKKIFEYFKNLFTLSDAQFIFICGEDLYNKIHITNNIETSRLKDTNSSEGDIYRPKEYTYFTSKFFLSRPMSQDLDAFFENIVENVKIEDYEEGYFEILKKSLLFESKNDFYDLKTYIRSRITNFEDEKPIIEYKELDRKDIKKARFQEAICILFEQKYMSIKSSKWRENEGILRELFDYAHKIYNSPFNAEFTDSRLRQEPQIVGEARRDFNKLLQRCGAFSILENNKTEGNSKELSLYRYCGEIPSKIPLRLEGRTEFEEKFVRLYEEYFDYVISILNSYKIHQNEENLFLNEFLSSAVKRKEVIDLASRFRFNPNEVFESYGKTYEILVHNDTLNTENINRDVIEERTQELINKKNTLIQNLPRIVGRIIQTLNPNLNTNSSAQKGNLLERIPQETRQKLLSDNDRYILTNQDLSKQILLIVGKEELLDIIKKQIFTDTQGYLVVFFAETQLMIKYAGLWGKNIRVVQNLSDGLQYSIEGLLNDITLYLLEEN